MNSPKTEHNRYVLLKRVFLNKYGLVFIAFLVWMIFFDTKNVFVQYKLSNRIEALEQDKKEYLVNYENVLKEKYNLKKDIEKFAREKYFMHKENEEVYILK
jgi:cell division protein FtsB